MKFIFSLLNLQLCRDSNYASGHSTELGGRIGIMRSARGRPEILHILGTANRGGTEPNTYALVNHIAEPMRIIYIITGLNIGGAETQLVRVAT